MTDTAAPSNPSFAFNMKPNPLFHRPATLLVACLLAATPITGGIAQQSEGDQFLDGIGETALVARYILNGNTQDRSRNSHHALLRGGGTFTNDSKFGQVLSLPGGENGGHLEVPRDALGDLDNVSITGWLWIRSDAPWQRFFDFGPGANAYFFCSPIGGEESEGYRARITNTGWEAEQGTVAPRVPTNRWVYLAVVLDSARQAMTAYLDGKRVASATNVTLNLEEVLRPNAANHLYIGKSQFETDGDLDAKLHDIRIYNVALTDPQIGTICTNAWSGRQAVASGGIGAAAQATRARPLPVDLQLERVPDIAIETAVGHLPRLPREVEGIYRSGAKRRDVRVLWPSPTNNLQVLEAGTYTLSGTVPGTALQPQAVVTVKAASPKPAPRATVEPFALSDVSLEKDEAQRETQFVRNRDKFLLGLAESNPDRFLYMFRNAFGQPQPEGAQPLRGWDSQTTRLRGHATGHYLTAIAQAYAGTSHDKELQAKFLTKMNYLIDTLHDLSQKSGRPANEGGESVSDPLAVPPGPGKSGYDSDLTEQGIRTDYWNWGKGFISAYPPDQFIMLEKGATYGGRNNQVWGPYYTLHKILAGLLDCYEVGGNRKALQVAHEMGLWVHERLKAVPASTRISMWNRYIAGEYGGMNEVLARMHRLTGDKRLLECAQLFDNINFFFGNAEHAHGLARNVDLIRGKHANQHIPQITGALETYRGTGDLRYFQVAENFWELCTGCYLYSIGGVAGARNPNNAECFTAEPDTLFRNGFATGGQNETCATYNLLKLSRQLFMFDQDAKYMDYYEQALYNHILASVAENNPGNTYHVPLNPGARKQFGNSRMDGFTCCNGTAIESSTKLHDSIYFKSSNDDALYVNLYVPSTLNWKKRNVTLQQRTSFPYSDTTRLTLNGGGAFELKLRVPFWATSGFLVKVNGEEQKLAATPGSYTSLRRTWKSNDVVEIRMPFKFRLDPVMDQPNIASLFYGPVLLAAEEPEARTDWRPVTLEAADPGKSIQGDPAALRFTVGDARFKPFFETYERHSVYLDVTLQ